MNITDTVRRHGGDGWGITKEERYGNKTHVGPWLDVVATEIASPKRHFTF